MACGRRQTHRRSSTEYLAPLAHGLVKLYQEIKALAFPKECLSLVLQIETKWNLYIPLTPTPPHP